MSEKRVIQLRPQDPDQSSVTEELEAIEREIAPIQQALASLERYNALVNEYEITDIRRRLNVIMQRVHRAEQCSRGLTVLKPT